MIAFAADPEKLYLFTSEQQSSPYEIISITNADKLVTALKSAQHYSQLIIDISMFQDSEQEIIKALFLLKSTNSTKIIIIAQGKSPGDLFLHELVKIGIYDFITAWETAAALQEMQECVTGRAAQEVEQYIITDTSSKGFFKAKSIKKATPNAVQIIGVCPRIGATTQAIRISKGLLSNGISACYREANKSGHLKLIKDVFSQVKAVDGNALRFGELYMLPSDVAVKTSFDYVVCDYGDYENISIDELDLSAKTVVVAGSSAWELVKLPQLITLLQKFTDVSYLFSFTDKKDEQDILDFMGEAWHKTFFAGYSPDMFGDINESEKVLYKKLVLNESKSGLSLLKFKAN